MVERGGVVLGPGGFMSVSQREQLKQTFGGTDILRRGGGGSGGTSQRQQEQQRIAQEKQETQKLKGELSRDLSSRQQSLLAASQSEFQTKILRAKDRNERLQLQRDLQSRAQEIKSQISVQREKIKTGSLQELKKIKVPEISAAKPTSTVTIAPTTRGQLRTQIERATPELKFLGKGDAAEFTRDVIGVVSGTAKFGKEKLIGQLTDLRDSTGKRIFTPKQARKTVQLSTEVAEGLVLGAGTGKLATLGRGAVAKAIPQALQGSSKFKKVVNTLDVAILGGLTVTEAKKLKNTFQKQGQDAALLQLIGLASFGTGFAKTGLKPSAQAQKEFKKAADILKKTIPKGKRGQAAIRKKLGQNRFDKLKQLDKKTTERAKKVVGELEKKIAKAKDSKEQFKILAEVKKQVKSPEAKANFQNFVRELIEKDIIKVPKVEVAPGVEAKIIAPPKEITVTVARPPVTKPTVTLPPRILPKALTPTAQRNLQRIREAQKKAQKTRVRSQQALGQRFREAQTEVQKQRFKTAQAFRQAQPSLLQQKPRLGVPTRPIRKLRRPPKLPKFPKPFAIPKKPTPVKRKKKKKVVKKPAIKSYNVVGKPLKQKRFRKLNQVPLTKEKAKDLGAWLIDNSLARTYKIVGSPKAAKKPKLKVPANYFDKNRKKFRTFRIVKGKKVPLKNKFIEKKGKPLLDTRAEKKKIKLLSQLSKLKKKAKIKSRRKK